MSNHWINNDNKNHSMDEFILLDEDKKRMYFTGNEDFQKHKKAFKARMKVLGHEGVINDDDDQVPVRPDDAYARRANGMNLPNDSKTIDYYKKEILTWNKSSAFVCWAWLETLDRKTVQTLEGEIRDLREEPSRDKWFEMVEVLQVRFGAWTKFKGDRNLLAIEEVPRFTTVETAHSGMVTIMKPKDERDAFVNPQAGIYNDEYYIPWLIERMDSWDKLTHLRYKFQHNTVARLTFPQMRGELLAELKLLEEESQKLGGKLHTAYMARMSGHVPPPTESDRVMSQPADFTGNVAASDSTVQQQLAKLQAQVSAMQSPGPAFNAYAAPQHSVSMRHATTVGANTGGSPSGPTTTRDSVICHTCGKRGHISRHCVNNTRNQPSPGQRSASTFGVGDKRCTRWWTESVQGCDIRSEVLQISTEGDRSTKDITLSCIGGDIW